MGRFLIALSGARQEILDRCPTERVKFQSLGWAILITSGMATVSMWFALSSAMGLNGFVAAPIALAWGLIIMGIDRWLVTSMPPGGARRAAVALPRLLLAVLLGSLISTPIVLRIFQSEINAQITLIKAQRASTFLTTLQKGQVGKQVTYWQGVVANLQKVVDSGGDVPINPSADPMVKSLTAQRATELSLEHKYYVQWQCQLYGGKGCTVKGNGPLAQASQRSYQQAVSQVAKLTAQIQQRDRQLSATDRQSRLARLHQANTALPGARQQLRVAVARQDALRAAFDAKNEQLNGLLIRLQALDQLSGSSATLNSARILLFLLFLVIECLPVTVKLLAQPGNYEKILQATAERELKDATRELRSRRRRPAGPLADAGHEDQGLQEIWQPTKQMPAPSADLAGGGAGTQWSHRDAETFADDARLDHDALREMEDLRVTADADWRAGQPTGHGGLGHGNGLGHGTDAGHTASGPYFGPDDL